MKLISAIALLGTAHHVFAEDNYNPSGRFELQHGDPDKMAITGTSTALEGKVYFTSSDDARFSYTVEYYDMAAAGDNPTTCLSGSFVNEDNTPTNAVGGTGLLDHVSVFNLPASIWNDNTAIICARMESKVTSNGEEIDAIETLATITRSFSGAFSINIATKTKNAVGFTSANNNNVINVDPFLCNDSNARITNSVEFAQGQDFKICVAYDSTKAAPGDDNAYNIDALKNVICSWDNPDSTIINDGDGSCLYANDGGWVNSGADCSSGDDSIFSIRGDESGRIVRVGDGDCLMMDDNGWLGFKACTDAMNQKFDYDADTKRLVKTVDGDEPLCASIQDIDEGGVIYPGFRMADPCSASSATFTIEFTNSDTLVDGSGIAQGLTELSPAGGSIMSFKGVVKNSYIENGNIQLTCKGDVDLSVASPEEETDEEGIPVRRLETINNVRFSTRARALQPRAAQPHAVQIRDLQERESEFSVGIRLDPTASSSASASNGMTSMVLMAAAGVLVALI